MGEASGVGVEVGVEVGVGVAVVVGLAAGGGRRSASCEGGRRGVTGCDQ